MTQEKVQVAKKSNNFMLFGLMGLATVLILFNIVSVFFVSNAISRQNLEISGLMTLSAVPQVSQTGAQPTSSSAVGTVSLEEVLPDGVPAMYGQELQVNLSDVRGENQAKADQVVKKLANLDGDLYPNGVMHFADLDETAKQRYLSIGMSIACEYCCGADSLIARDGKPACGCAHSAAMRGLAMYLLANHAAHFSDEQIIEELGKLKALFFPKNAVAKAEILKEKQIPVNYSNLMSNAYFGIEKQGTSSSGSSSAAEQVGGC